MGMKLPEWIIEKDIGTLQAAMEKGEFDSVALVGAYLDRIRKYDPAIRSVLEINPDALEIAKSLDREREERGSRGPLHGIPILLKDNIDTGDRMHTSAGSIALASSFAAEDSAVAARLREAGAVLLGKTNMTEWANFMSSTMWSGYSSRGGQTENPYGPGELFVGGSSSGSGASIAASFAAAAIGTETMGSIISPSCQHMLVGIKPTVGLVGRSGIIPITSSQDTAGPMARTVADAAAVLGAIVGADARDPASNAGIPLAQGYSADSVPMANIPFAQGYTGNSVPMANIPFAQGYAECLDEAFLKQSVIGIPRHYVQGLDAERLSIFEAAIETLRSRGATIVDPVSLRCEDKEWNGDVLRYEFKKALNDYLGKLPEHVPVHSLKEVIAYNEMNADRALKYGQGTLIWSEETSGTLTEPEYVAALAMNVEARRAIDEALREHGLDALLFFGADDGTDLAARAGYPSICVPAGYAKTSTRPWGEAPTSGPQGVSFVGTAFSETTLIKIAYGYEQATKHRFAPDLKASSED
ncbi:amidase family protein [Cohnella suwonensis]|uniref:Amidase family protein n=1 Tax=Cohnella suwonensis TaxID=696072 RepID=A0ABW0LSL7_9BACL